MVNRGRPRKLEISVWDKKYYKLSTKEDDRVIKQAKIERLIKAYNDLHILAFDEEMSWSQTNKIREMLYL